MSPVLIIAGLTLREAVRRRIALAALALGALFVLVYNIALYFVIREWSASGFTEFQQGAVQRAVLNGLALAGLYAINFLSLALGALLAADTLAGEINSGAIQSIVTKPLARWQVVAGKWLGFAAMLALYLGLMCAGVLIGLAVQADYRLPGLERGLPALWLISLLVMTITLTLSSRISSLATGGVIFGLYGLGFIGGAVEQIGTALENQSAIDIGIFSSLLIPTEALWRWASGQMTSPLVQAVGAVTPFSGFGNPPSTLMLAYAGLYLLVAFGLGVRWFGRRDL
jgi:ABC-type transport system involved in multi-copper enzyme maturation permease subunit